MLNAGTLRQRITIEQMHATDTTYSTWKTRWAEVIPSNSDTLEIRMRYLDGIDQNKHRIIWRDQVWEIDSVYDTDGRKRDLQITAVAPQPNNRLRG